MGAENLNLTLNFFLFEARKQDGGLYPSHILYGIYTSLQSAIRAKGCTVNMFEDKEFEDSRRCLDAVMRNRSAEGLGTGSRKLTETISLTEEEQLWQCGALGDDTPRKLLDTVLYLTGLHFALRGGKEHRTLRMSAKPQIMGPHTDGNGRKFLLYTEDVSKTNLGGLTQSKQTPMKVRTYENINKDRCYFSIFQKYRSLC
ncbi:uncharacterized protein KIAA1958-like [Haliotis asinina]|uniref:uncharacterized protein KIAA1958-like n=1 Tax=Haliotis asinina TaxID=109174 RepID=UPI003531EAD6